MKSNHYTKQVLSLKNIVPNEYHHLLKDHLRVDQLSISVLSYLESKYLQTIDVWKTEPNQGRFDALYGPSGEHPYRQVMLLPGSDTMSRTSAFVYSETTWLTTFWWRPCMIRCAAGPPGSLDTTIHTNEASVLETVRKELQFAMAARYDWKIS